MVGSIVRDVVDGGGGWMLPTSVVSELPQLPE